MANTSTGPKAAFTGFGLDDSDLDEFLESSDDEPQPLLIAPTLKAPAPQSLLTAVVWRGPKDTPSGDASRTVPCNR